jgi:hypothetical protein
LCQYKLMETLGDKIMPKLCQRFNCNFCLYYTSKKSSFDKHLLSTKHKKSIKGDGLETFGDKIMPKLCSTKFCCENCNKGYTSRNGLWKHNKKCRLLINKDDLIVQILKQNAELVKQNTQLIKGQQDMMIKFTENGIYNNTTTHTNSHNKAFNLNFFLNETCKNAMNINDFVDSIKLQLSDLMDVGELGYVEGISKIIVNNLNNLDETQRPIHCTDKKRETMYIKHQGQWEKDNNKHKIKKVVRNIANKNIRLLPQFRENYPDYTNSSLKISDTYEKMVIESMTSDENKDEKIIKNISKVTTIREKERESTI